MNEKSAAHLAFYEPLGADEEGRERVASLPSTAGPWSPDSQHGGPPAGLLTRALEQHPEAVGMTPGRITVDLLGPVPVGELAVEVALERPGRSVRLLRATAYDVARGRPVMTARAWFFPVSGDGPGRPHPLPHGPAEGIERPRPEGWHGGYLDAVEWRWISGSVTEPGPGTVWMRAPDLVAGEPISPVQRLLTSVDSASGISAALDLRAWTFLNTDLTVHLLRPPVGAWLCVDAETTLGPGSVGIATSSVHDELGVVARTAQALLVLPR